MTTAPAIYKPWPTPGQSHFSVLCTGVTYSIHHHTKPPLNSKMQASNVALFAFLFAVLLVSQVACATYRKPPFNGSIFGKRGNAVDYDSAGKALSAMCEIASEACSAWFPQPENN